MQALLYVSEETTRLEPDRLMALLRAARETNRRLGVSGLLACRDGQFMQILEGEADVLKALFETIARDSRHRAVERIWQGEIERRDFRQWPMAFRVLSDAQVERLPAFAAALEAGFLGAPLREDPEMARALMLALRDLI